MEIELKLGLHASDPASLERLLARTPMLARRKPVHQLLHNIYYDTPADTLHQQRVALRIRRTGSATHPQWLQTLKTGGASTSAFSQRGEWEAGVAGAQLDQRLLEATPWSQLDPNGTVFKSLVPRFTTIFERTSWVVRQRDGSAEKVSLDIGQIVAGDQSTPICELELELLAGDAAAIFRVAHQIASRVAVMPLNISKAERGYALERSALQAPRHALPPALTPDLPVHTAAQRVLREMFCQFTTNLNALQVSSDPEVVHQARVGWRRFKSAVNLFRKVPWVRALPSVQPLQVLLMRLGELRDIEVATTQTLPSLANAYASGNRRRQGHWHALQKALARAETERRQAVREALDAPAVGGALLAITEWLEGQTAPVQTPDSETDPETTLRRWAKRSVKRLHGQLRKALRHGSHTESQHRSRILAKRLRYGIEAMQPFLPKRRTQRWYQLALRLQTDLGAARDFEQALLIATELDVNRELVEFLRSLCSQEMA